MPLHENKRKSDVYALDIRESCRACLCTDLQHKTEFILTDQQQKDEKRQSDLLIAILASHRELQKIWGVLEKISRPTFLSQNKLSRLCVLPAIWINRSRAHAWFNAYLQIATKMTWYFIRVASNIKPMKHIGWALWILCTVPSVSHTSSLSYLQLKKM